MRRIDHDLPGIVLAIRIANTDRFDLRALEPGDDRAAPEVPRQVGHCATEIFIENPQILFLVLFKRHRFRQPEMLGKRRAVNRHAVRLDERRRHLKFAKKVYCHRLQKHAGTIAKTVAKKQIFRMSP